MNARLRPFFESILGPDRPLPRWLRMTVVAGISFGLFWYVTNALAHGHSNNTNPEYNDQRVYLHYAISMATPMPPGVERYTPRMRMPAYPWLLSFAARPHMDDDDLFSVAQAFNIFLSLAGLAVLYFLLRRWLGAWIGLCYTLAAGFQLYLLRAAYVQPELLLTTVITITWAWLIYTLRHPGWRNGLIAGLLLCLWFLTKASAQAALGLFLVILGAKWLFAGRGKRLPYLITGAVVVVAYLVPMTPYLHTSWKYFHDPFYNAQSKYYLWCEPKDDKHDDKHELQRLNLDINLANLPKDLSTLPSFHKYMKTHQGHVFHDIKLRIFKGTGIMFKLAFADYSPFYFMISLFMGAAVWGACRAWPESIAFLWDWKWEAIYVVGLATAFTLLFGWFTVIKVGPRLIESITLAPAFFFAACAHRFLRNQAETLWGARISMEKLFTVLFLVLWLGVTLSHAPSDMLTGYFGG